ncbi:hypothetical protein ALMP_73600 [Streptomyces sp. A012304]|nr:hypothetical protein ALMP_73600 [Streptomyces sp. A012304]
MKIATVRRKRRQSGTSRVSGPGEVLRSVLTRGHPEASLFMLRITLPLCDVQPGVMVWLRFPYTAE